uniref:Uncharacterized protein n=1 Tax=Magallana gigas TaxID=29159 RepID=A0A8W8KAC2_MAGGI
MDVKFKLEPMKPDTVAVVILKRIDHVMSVLGPMDLTVPAPVLHLGMEPFVGSGVRVQTTSVTELMVVTKAQKNRMFSLRQLTPKQIQKHMR